MEELLLQLQGIIDEELPLISNLANASAILNQLPNLNWCGFYLVHGDSLYLGPFQGEAACTVIPKGKGVCGTAFLEKKTIIVPNVDLFPGHIACSSASKSEIVVPIIKNEEVVGVIDLDAPLLSRFSEKEAKFLESVAATLSKVF